MIFLNLCETQTRDKFYFFSFFFGFVFSQIWARKFKKFNFEVRKHKQITKHKILFQCILERIRAKVGSGSWTKRYKFGRGDVRCPKNVNRKNWAGKYFFYFYRITENKKINFFCIQIFLVFRSISSAPDIF